MQTTYRVIKNRKSTSVRIFQVLQNRHVPQLYQINKSTKHLFITGKFSALPTTLGVHLRKEESVFFMNKYLNAFFFTFSQVFNFFTQKAEFLRENAFAQELLPS